MRKPWAMQSRRYKKSRYINLKNKIGKATSNGGQYFVSPLYLHDKMQWIDFSFIGSRRRVYSATLATAAFCYHDDVNSLAWDMTDEIIHKHNIYLKPHLPCEGKLNDDSIIIGSGASLPCLDNLNFMEYKEKMVKQIIDEKKISVNEFVKIDHSYTSGIGVEAVINCDKVTIDLVDRFIELFIAKGEKCFHNATKLHFDYERCKQIKPYIANRIDLALFEKRLGG